MKITDLRSISAKGERWGRAGRSSVAQGSIPWAQHRRREGGSRSRILPQGTASSGGEEGGDTPSTASSRNTGAVAVSLILGTWAAGGGSGAGGAGLGVPAVPCLADPDPSCRRRAGDHAEDGDPRVDAAPHPGDVGELGGHGHAGGSAGWPPCQQPGAPPGQLQPQPFAQLQPQQPGHALAVTRARRAPGQSPARRHAGGGTTPCDSALAAAPLGRTSQQPPCRRSPGTPLPERTPAGSPAAPWTPTPPPPPSPGRSALVESHFRGAGALGRIPGDTPAPPAPAHMGLRPPSHPPVPSRPSGGEDPARPRTPRKQSHLKEKAKYIYINIYKYL